MTEPLIDRDALLVEIAEEFVRDGGVWMTPNSVLDAVLAYLRGVLTPEALWDKGEGPSIGEQIHRRIFGEDK